MAEQINRIIKSKELTEEQKQRQLRIIVDLPNGKQFKKFTPVLGTPESMKTESLKNGVSLQQRPWGYNLSASKGSRETSRGKDNGDILHVGLGTSERKQRDKILELSDVKPPQVGSKLVVQTTVSIQPANNSSTNEIEDLAKEVIGDTSNTCVLKTDKEIDVQMKKLIKQQVLKERPYKKNEAIDFWRRQRLQIKASRNSNPGSDEPHYFKSQEFDLQKSPKRLSPSPSQKELEFKRLYGG